MPGHDDRPLEGEGPIPELDAIHDRLRHSAYSERIRQFAQPLRGKIVAAAEAGRSGYLLRFTDGAWAVVWLSPNERRMDLAVGTGAPAVQQRLLLDMAEAGDASVPLTVDEPYANEPCDIAVQVQNAVGKPVTGTAVGEDSFNLCFPKGRELEAMLVTCPDGRVGLRVFWEQW